ncbi:MAG TPA: hypothetical protein VH373_14010 [Jatrophihabitantaceae bacterium]
MPERRPKDLSELELGFARQRAVRWLSPRVLVATGTRALLASIFGSYSDKRELQAVLPSIVHRHDTADELWFDFVADVGDGFDATYSVASLLAAPELDVDGTSLPRGRILVLGGDEVYPVASTRGYEDRTKGPYHAALPEPPVTLPTMFALPGNHDWYDGLTAFLRVFTQQRPIGGWATEQTRSYFAVGLPQRWWLFGVDAQLTSYIDAPQLEYFRQAARQLRPGDAVLLCWSTPAWAHTDHDPSAYDPIDFFDREIVRPTGASIRVMLSGDSHHYARYASADDEQRITCGTGGAYLVATHRLPESIELPSPKSRMRRQTPTRPFRLRTRYPDKFTSRWLSPGILGLGWRNPGFVALLGAVQAVFVISLVFAVDYGRRFGGGWSSLQTLRASLPALLIAVVIVWGAVGFARIDPHSPRRTALVAGLLHGLAQVGLGIGWTAAVLRLHDEHWLPDTALAVLAAVVTVILIGAVAGLLTGIYLTVVSQFDVNLNEAFAGQSIEDYKGFLRLHIGRDGALTIHPIKIPRVCHSWRADPDGAPDEPWLRPAEPLRVELLEEPIRVPRA